jgi:hypothetical protein
VTDPGTRVPPGPPVAVTFDFWNTLVAENAQGSHRHRRWLEVLVAHGIDVTAEQLTAAIEAGWHWFDQR